jgi:molecular chaperone DnaJ
MTLRDKGNQSDNGPSGDLIIKLIVEKHPKFRKQGDDIVTTEWLTISQAALGCKKKI